MPCTYFANNGKPSILFDTLYKHFLTEENGDNVKAERRAVGTWLHTRTKEFKSWFGDWEQSDSSISTAVDKNGEPLMHLQEAKRFNGDKLPTFTSTIAPPGETTKNIYDQMNRLPDLPVRGFTTEFGTRFNDNKNVQDLVSGNTTFDEYITATNDHISRLNDQLKNTSDRLERDELKQRIEKQSEILSQFKKNKSIRILIQNGLDQIGDVAKYALKEDANILELNEGIRLSKAWSKLTEFIDFDVEDQTEGEIELLDTARKLAGDASILYSKISNRLMQHLVEVAGTSFNTDITSALSKNKTKFVIRDIDAISTNTLSIDHSSNPIDQFTSAVLDTSNQQFDEEHFNFIQEHDTIKLKTLGAVKAGTKFMLETYDRVIKGEDGKTTTIKENSIVSIFDRTFENEYFDMQDKARKGTISWKAFYKFENNHFSYELTPEGKQDFENYMEEIKQKYTTIDEETGEEIVNEKEIEKVRVRFDPGTFSEYLAGNIKEPNAGGTFFTKTPKNIKYNPAYERLTPGQKEYHNWFTTTLAKYHHNSIFDYKLGEIDMDELLHSFVHNTDQPGIARRLGTATKEWLKNLVSVVAENNRNNIVNRPLTGKKHINAQFKNIATFVDSHKHNVEPDTILTDFVRAVISFKTKATYEELLNTINDAAQIAEKKEVTNSGVNVKDRAGKEVTTISSKNVADRLEYAIESHLKGTARDKNQTLMKKGPGERGFSLGQLLDSLNTLTRARYMALSPLSATGNLLMGGINNYIYAAGNKYFTTKQLFKAMGIMRGATMKFVTDSLTNKKVVIASDQTKLIADIMYRHNIIGDVTEELIYGESALSKLYSLQKGGEFLVQGASAIAQMLNTPVKIKQADGTLKDGNYFELYSYDRTSNRSVFNIDKLADDSPFREIAKRRQVIQKIKLVNQKIHGDYAGALRGKKTNFGRMLFMFRTWVPMAIKERFGAEYEHAVLGTQKGRYKSALDVFSGAFYNKESGEWFKDTNSTDLLKTFLKLIPFTNKFIKLSDKISDIDRENIDMFVREIHVIIAMLTAMTFLKSSLNSPDDDPDSTEHMFMTYLTNQSGRIQQELSLYYMPSSYSAIFQNLIPLSNTLIDGEKLIKAMGNYIVDPESDEYKTGYRKGRSKAGTRLTRFLPVTRSIETTWSAFSQLYQGTVTGSR